jgi:hypothetical protein
MALAFASAAAGLAAVSWLARLTLIHAAEVPTSRPPMLAAKLSPVPRRCVG